MRARRCVFRAGQFAAWLACSACCLLPAAFCLSAASPSPAPDIRDIVAPQPFYVTGGWWLLVLAVGCVAAAGLVGWVLYRNLRRPKVVVPPSPHEVAAGRLETLRARVDQFDPRAFGEEAADILRAFIGAQYGLQAQRQTSPEFLEAVRGSTLFSTAQHGVLAGFLTQCDLLKFAREDATREGKLRLIEQAGRFLEGDSKMENLPAPGAPALPLSPGSFTRTPPLPPGGVAYPFETPDARYMPREEIRN